MEKKDEFPCFRKSVLGTIVKFTGVTEGITVPLDGKKGVRSNNFWRYDDENFWTPCEDPKISLSSQNQEKESEI